MTDTPPWQPGPFDFLFRQLAAHLQARIDSGELEPGRRLPPEREIAAEYGVSLTTARHAMELLRERGYIVTLHGRGTFVAERH